MFMTTKTHERLLAAAIVAETKRCRVFLDQCQNALGVQRSIAVAQQIEITDMQHFYNKGRAVHAADVRYETKKRASRYANKTQTMAINLYPCKFEDIP